MYALNYAFKVNTQTGEGKNILDHSFWQGVKKIREVLQDRDHHTGRATLESFRKSMNAFASYLVPADTDLLPTDLAAGDLKREIDDTGVYETFADHVFRLVKLLDKDPVYAALLILTEHEVISFLYELDAQADAVDSGKAYWELSAEDQKTVGDSLIYGGATPITIPLDAAALYTLATLVNAYVTNAYYANFPYNKVRTNQLGMGQDQVRGFTEDSEVILTDAANLISNPRQTDQPCAFTYLGYYFPLSKSLEDQLKLAMLDAGNPALAAASEAKLQELLGKDFDGTLHLE